jgi:hypothetical protein
MQRIELSTSVLPSENKEVATDRLSSDARAQLIDSSAENAVSVSP